MAVKQKLAEKEKPINEPEPVMAKSVLYVSEESIGHVENFFRSFDVDRKKKIRKVVAGPPVLDRRVKWYGDGSSDPE